MKTLDLLRLSLIKGINNIDLLYANKHYDTLSELIDDKNQIKKLNAKIKQGNIFGNIFDNTDKQLQEQIEKIKTNEVKLISINDNLYPESLKQIYNPPALLFVKGNLQNPDSLSISIVGTRKCTSYGKKTVDKFSKTLSDNNIIITSGMAYGIDSFAHKGALKHGGITYAVIASGLDQISTHRAQKIADEIIGAGGAIISNYHMGVKALPFFFLQRNRIISGISNSTIVIESGIKGGALWTAKYCIEQNRNLFAVPGNIFSEKSKGTNKLIYDQKAIPATSGAQILKEIGFDKIINKPQDEKIKFKNEEEKVIYDAMEEEPIHIDELANMTDLNISELQVNLLTLEFNNLVKQLPGKYYLKY